MRIKNIMIIFGTRPEAIKMAPIIKELENHSDKIRTIITLSAQHREMLDQVLEIFDIRADYDLNVMTDNQKLSDITCNVIQRFEKILEKETVDFLLVQGDTTTTFAASLIGFYHKIPVGHVEAGLRTNNMYYPFPEELNRVLTTRLASVHFAPTQLAKENLLREGIGEQSIVITGNTVIDALFYITQKEEYDNTKISDGKKKILVTAHRRENFGIGLENICKAILNIVERHHDVEIDFPVHLNPNVQATVRNYLSGHDRIKLIEPLDYRHFCKYIAESFLILTDSGGIQEEAPSLGKPVLVLRNETERQEAIDAGTARLVGVNTQDIVEATELLLTNPDHYQLMAKAVNPYGDGKAGKRIVEYILNS
ncbi:MAG: UDP-N-acetylglucosamine 2-epimerase (non-hydrolyzing) [Nitrosopumilaceae archaeon]|nr:UDP-N-acetylglucosamine 2-epimerase (non-hydrolyzing) [Nitrosopumilaceae archaeon]NIU88467.1 UDP-N-acetylglucosamine 2-epimerase (non-hydrolyzing) [Nitrosopumilaceae archaeon]NIV66720.1 UDP-N-acetylglucosamine 2-epimerase (non-hydrolyzing) [Nitrosopumilaceae archaeon]NIX62672.1 UDP-N-acetylglucosamine 2-epimerase (non-hydrolyzing) [Nitrosopumilaceae archaeon]